MEALRFYQGDKPFARVVDALGDRVVKRSADKAEARCPAHEDSSPSLSIGTGADGRVLLRCHAGCDAGDVLAAIGLDLSDLFAGLTIPRGRSEIVATYGYEDEHGELLYEVVRKQPKDFLQRRPDGAGGWIWNTKGVRRVPYSLPALLKAHENATIVVVEGEKDADRLIALGHLATCNAGGAGKWTLLEPGPIENAFRDRDVVVVPDDDEAGRKHVDDVARSLESIASQVRVIALPRLPGMPAEQGDVSDWLDAGGDARSLDGMIATARPWAPASNDLSFNTDADHQNQEQPSLPASAPPPERYDKFPCETLTPYVREFVQEASAAIGCDESFVALPLLSSLGAAIGNSRRVEVKPGWAEPPVLWTVTVGRSGTTKSPARDQALRPIRGEQQLAFAEFARQMEDYEQAHQVHERELRKWKAASEESEPPTPPDTPTARRLVVSDATVESLAPILLANPRGVLLERDEFAAWLDGFNRYKRGSSDLAAALEWHRAGPLTVDRKTGHPATIYVPSAFVAITGSIQPGRLTNLIGAEHRDSGMLARFLMAYPTDRVRRWTDRDVPSSVARKLVGIISVLLELHVTLDDNDVPQPEDVPLSAEARELFASFVNEHGEEMETLDDDERAAWSKLEGAAARLALVHHYCRWAEGGTTILPGATVAGSSVASPIDVESVEAGIRLARWFGREARRAYSMMRERPLQRESRELHEYLRTHGGRITPRQLARGPRRFRGVGGTDRAEEELQRLVDVRWACWEVLKPERGGHPERECVLVDDSGDGDARPQ